MKFSFGKFDTSATETAAKFFGKWLGALIILSVTLMGDVMYIILMSAHFPTGLLLAFCYLGAISSFLAMIYLLLGKTVFFHPGKQMVAAWAMVIVEMIIIALNTDLVFVGVRNATGLLAVWLDLSPATPVIIMAFLLMVYFLDPELAKKHEDMENEDKQAKLQREFELLQFKAEMDIKTRTLQITHQLLMDELNDPANKRAMEGNAARLFAGILSGFSGLPIPPRINPKTVDAAQPASLSQTGKTSVPPEPTTQPLRPSSEELEEYRRWKAQQQGPLQ